MSKNTGTTTITVIISLIVASAIFAATAVNAPQYKPQPYTSQRTLENGLIASIRFTNDTYNAISWVSASYEYYNPTDNPINATLPRSYPVYSGYEGQTPLLTPYTHAHPRNVTIQPGETIDVISFNCLVIAPGTYTANLNGTYTRVVIHPTTLVPRVVTERASYRVGEAGTATLEIFNSGSASELRELQPLGTTLLVCQ